MTEYPVIIEKSENNFGAWVPDLDGCVSTGATEQEVVANIKKAIELHLKGLREDGLNLPEPSRSVLIEIA